MDPTVEVNLALLALKSVLALIAEIKTQHSLADDALMAQARAIAGDDDTIYAALKASLAPLLTTPPTP